MTETNHDKPFLTPEEFWQDGLKKTIGRGSVYDLVRANRIRHTRIGRRILIPRSEIHDFPLRETSN